MGWDGQLRTAEVSGALTNRMMAWRAKRGVICATSLAKGISYHYLNDEWAWASVQRDDNAAIREIDGAIGEIKRAAIDDGNGLNDPFPIDVHLSPHDRFRKVNELLWSAHNDLAKAEDVPQSRGLRDRAIGHVDLAHNIVDAAERTGHWE